ncbi:lytic murein transglycosylase [Thiothrix nivea]|uniref:Lytic murein transglycosylase n=1 Tax=Thiothrix nivea (strain ATCC 35100 / DSM 5205 / JP2) TaxID=870187 RepID=A0A656HNL9_THINJ|nr:lytic murein transglycosylase [Thiothrix nivea]EIJ36635.1 lytic murein transglycosylase [Thiothrix nivea DSM 5205]
MNRNWLHWLLIIFLMAVALFGFYALKPDREFEAWKSRFSQLAATQGISAETAARALGGLAPDKKVLRLEAHQPEFTKPVWEYLESAVSDERIAAGQKLLREQAPLLQRIYQQFGVQPEYVLAVWGVESNYGRNTGGYNIFRSLATLAYAGIEDRRSFWQAQLLAALRILDEGDMPLASMQGSWAGAIGHTQFIPTTFEEYAVDFDGDGKRDLLGSIPDALASTANYLAQSGWERGRPWGQEVRLPAEFDWSRADPEFWLPANVWSLDGGLVAAADGAHLMDSDPAFVFLPAGYRGPAFLAYPNFSVILKYNNANNYALAVGYLGDRIRGAGPLVAAWPEDEEPLSLAQKSELQELLTVEGYSTDGVDGKIGPNTRSALRRWQVDAGFPADGYATLEHLQYLQQRVKKPEVK